MGRHTEYTPEIAKEFCSRLVDGTSVRTVCKDEEMPCTSTIFKWMAEQPEFSEQYAKAKMMAAEALAEEIFDIVDDEVSSPVMIDGVPLQIDGKIVMARDNVGVQHAKLRADVRKWYLSKIMPKKYGDKIQNENINVEMSHDEWVASLK